MAGRTALVTGSTSGIGEAVARVLAAAGARVAVSGRNVAGGRRVVDDIAAAGGHAHWVPADLTAGPAQVRAFADTAAVELGGQVDILVNNAGVYPVGPTEALSDADLDALLSTNVRAPHVLVAALAPAMAERGTGAIVNIGSWMARVGTPFGALYTATKAALEQLTRNWAAEYGPRGVRVTTVAPGIVPTPGNADSAELVEAMAKATVAGRPVRPVDIAFAVRYLVSDAAEFLAGSTIDVDGGLINARLS